MKKERPLDRPELDRRIAEARAHAEPSLARALERLETLEADFLVLSEQARAHLLGSSLTWSEIERAEATWLRNASDQLAIVGYGLCQAAIKERGPGDGHAFGAMARTLRYMGDAVKWDVAVNRQARHDLAKPHAIMRSAMAAGRQREPLSLRVDGREADCTLEFLYFRVLLLARFTSGALNSKQIEILDAWMWLWMPALKAVEDAPGDSVLRVDLDSTDGLRRGKRTGIGPSLYLPPGPIEEAYRSIVQEFHAGRLVPSHGITTTFRIEEHVAVLDLIRQGLRDSGRPLVSRADRHETNLLVELHVGLAEVMERAFSPEAPPAATLTLAVHDGQRVDGARLERDRDTAVDAVYERPRRLVRVANVSETGFGIEGDERDCGAVSVGDLVALRLERGGALELGKVVRSVSATPGRTWVGVRRIFGRARPIEVVQPSALLDRRRDMTLLFVPGEDESGRHDACLVTERAYTEGAPLDAYVGDFVYTFRFNRPRDRGRGWVLAGFEIMAAGSANEIRIA